MRKPLEGKTITRKAIMCMQGSRFLKHTREHFTLGLDGWIRMLMQIELRLFSEDIHLHISGEGHGTLVDSATKKPNQFSTKDIWQNTHQR
nr:hypothetical protein Iba_chr15aCG15500 [Ipomoea batatas]GMD97959.1 hypothetical protein Iba_chr15cCG7520 [Ipomoea batatas]